MRKLTQNYQMQDEKNECGNMDDSQPRKKEAAAPYITEQKGISYLVTPQANLPALRPNAQMNISTLIEGSRNTELSVDVPNVPQVTNIDTNQQQQQQHQQPNFGNYVNSSYYTGIPQTNMFEGQNLYQTPQHNITNNYRRFNFTDPNIATLQSNNIPNNYYAQNSFANYDPNYYNAYQQVQLRERPNIQFPYMGMNNVIPDGLYQRNFYPYPDPRTDVVSGMGMQGNMGGMMQYERRHSAPPAESPKVQPVTPKKRNRMTYTKEQLDTLEKEYNDNKFIQRAKRMILAEGIHLSERQIKIWFQNRRMKNKKDKQKPDLYYSAAHSGT